MRRRRRVFRRYTEAALRNAASKSFSVAETIRHLGWKTWSGGLHRYISSQLKKFGIDTSHFTGRASNAGSKHTGGSERTKPEDLLTLRESGTRQSRKRLLSALRKLGREYKCARCNQVPMWYGEALTLHIDHENGNRLDDRPENLRFLCPNCHSQQLTSNGIANRKVPWESVISTYEKCGNASQVGRELDLAPSTVRDILRKSGVKLGETPMVIKWLKPRKKKLSGQTCLDCTKPISIKAARCKSCVAKSKAVRKIEWPPTDLLVQELETSSYLAVAKRLGVSDNAVRKYLASQLGDFSRKRKL